PYFVQAYGKVTWDVAASSPIAAADVAVAAPEAEGELAVGFFGSRYERATPAEREYMRAMALIGDEPVPTSAVAEELSRKPSSLSPARDGLIKKGLIYSSERSLLELVKLQVKTRGWWPGARERPHAHRRPLACPQGLTLHIAPSHDTLVG